MKYFDNGQVAYFEMEDFDEQGNLKIQFDKPVVIMLQATWCVHCTTFKPLYQKFSMQSKDNVFSANIQADGTETEKKLMGVMTKLVPGFRGFPTIIAYKNGKYNKTYEGPRTVEGLLEFSKSL